nr:MAG: NUMOD4 motif [Bacteriophage sp.]
MIFDPNYKEVDIKGYEGLYKISNKGDVISLSKIRGFYKYRTNTGKMTANDYTHLFGYLNPYYRSAYNISKRRK